MRLVRLLPMPLVIHAESHLDHDLSPAHVAWLLIRFADRDAFFLETVELPPELSPVQCGLYGPVLGDESVAEADVRYVVRGSRKCVSRIVERPARNTRTLTVIAGPAHGLVCVLYTSYGGPSAPREPGDTSLPTWEAVLESRAFWSTHALTQ